ncbi:MAG: hypothetical protein KatS3mg031_1994 [Chitinophagales bacterium]|nr:MAG: hypothetical protein KatS3mg031_1994 [Chitinophagales bacterium]
MSQTVFYDATLQQIFEREGIVSLPLFSKEELVYLQEIYQQTLPPSHGLSFHSTMFIPDMDYRKKTDQVLRSILSGKINRLLKEYRLLFANFITKEASPDTAVGIHQDWNFTSPEYLSLNIWIPLVDIDKKTGLFYALKGSHHVFSNLRYTPYETDAYAELENYIRKNATPFRVRAGEALIYHGAMVHFSDPNISGQPRIAVGCALIPQSAPNLHYYRRPQDKKIEIFTVDESFYHSFNFFERPARAEKTGELNACPGLPALSELISNRMSSMRRIFRNDVLESEISRKGYVIIRNMVEEQVCDDLYHFFDQHDTVDHRPFSITNWSNNAAYRSKTFQYIAEKLLPVSRQYLLNYRPVMGVFTAKRPSVKSDMLLHQDWSLVDESVFRSVSVWVALCDMNKRNGNLQVAEYSHLYAGLPRGMNIPVPFEDLRQEIQTHFLTDLPLAKGDAVVFDHRLIHASPENQTERIRLAAVLALIPYEADLIHYYKYVDNDHELEILKMDEGAFHLIDFFDMPNKPRHIEVLKTIPAEFGSITKEDILQYYSHV